MKSRTPVMAALLSLTVLGAGCATTTGGTAIWAGQAPAITANTLAGLLLPAAQVAAELSGGDVVVTRQVTAPWDDSAGIAGGVGCLAVAGAAQRDVYNDTGWTAMQGQVLREPPAAQAWAHFASQAVVLFQTAPAAQEFFARSRQTWADCSGRNLNYTPPLAPQQLWSIGPVSVHNDILTVSREQRSPQRWSCQRALTVNSTVAVDVEACAMQGPTSAASAIARAIAERIGPA